MSDRLLTVDQLAELLSVKRDWIYQQVHRRELPFVKLGRRSLRFEEKAIQRWIAARAVGEE